MGSLFHPGSWNITSGFFSDRGHRTGAMPVFNWPCGCAGGLCCEHSPKSGTDLRMKIALLTTDNRENFREYEKPLPYFGTAPEALLQGFTRLPEIEVHVLTCTQKPMCAPAKLAANIWFHSLHVRRIGWLRDRKSTRLNSSHTVI